MDTENHSNISNARKKKKKKCNQNSENKFQFDLNSCSKNKDLRGAISLYGIAISQNLRISQHHFNSLLYLCSNSVKDPSLKDLALDYGFRVFDRMLSIGINPNEASITAVARLAAAKGDGDCAFELVKSMGKYNLTPRLRTYDPALFCFCENLDAGKAYEVEEHMGVAGISLEEAEISSLLKVSADTGKEERVYGYLHKLRSSVRCVSESTAKNIEDWFRNTKTSEVGALNLDADRLKELILRNGGGWHGRGWIGKGNWVVHGSNVNTDGCCCSCFQKLVCVDIDDDETDKFAQSVAGLAMEREVKANFSQFQAWLDKHNDYKAIVDGANIGLYQQNFADGGFSTSQLDSVVNELYHRNGKKWPLVVLHSKRIRGLLENPSCSKLVEEWIDKGVLYTTPSGSNDDWYWLYAAVKLKCLLVTNDEMRDHIFELLGSNFFTKWKERHQVRYTFVKGNAKLQMPPPYSLVIQESEKGTWHVPVVGHSNEESNRTWLCITRLSASDASNNDLTNEGNSENGHLSCNSKSTNPCQSENVTNNGGHHCLTGKRKERSPSPS
ncbi:proteinaceous RNase P 1 [Quillaja saponaria]|uniref:ribonuclease P n=1 Tax=Quillaja saponaria TaxID=32244 RepID=A0AAD7QGJ9_QUISA|nr:proteinaceous RNase P 1 [Quillaja saponaria]